MGVSRTVSPRVTRSIECMPAVADGQSLLPPNGESWFEKEAQADKGRANSDKESIPDVISVLRSSFA